MTHDHEEMTLEQAEAVLEMAPDATPEEIRAAYLAQVRLHPPDRSPEQFERIRDAYQLLTDPRTKAARQLEGGDATRPFITLFERHRSAAPRFTGPAPWLAVLSEKRPLPRS